MSTYEYIKYMRKKNKKTVPKPRDSFSKEEKREISSKKISKQANESTRERGCNSDIGKQISLSILKNSYDEDINNNASSKL